LDRRKILLYKHQHPSITTSISRQGPSTTRDAIKHNFSSNPVIHHWSIEKNGLNQLSVKAAVNKIGSERESEIHRKSEKERKRMSKSDRERDREEDRE